MEADNIGRGNMHDKMEETPEGLAGRNIAGIQVLPNLIITGAKLHGDTIMALVDILVDVLQGLDGGDDLNVDVAAVFPYEIGTVSDDPAIVHLLSSDLKGLASVAAP
jgi:hypothetical protein